MKDKVKIVDVNQDWRESIAQKSIFRFFPYVLAIIVLPLLFLAASGERAITRVDTVKLPYDSPVDFRFGLFKADSTFSYRFGTSDDMLPSPQNPCDKSLISFTALTYTAGCKDNPFHCQVCGHPFKVADALVLYVTSVEGQTTTAQYAHYICTLKPKKK